MPTNELLHWSFISNPNLKWTLCHQGSHLQYIVCLATHLPVVSMGIPLVASPAMHANSPSVTLRLQTMMLTVQCNLHRQCTAVSHFRPFMRTLSLLFMPPLMPSSIGFMLLMPFLTASAAISRNSLRSAWPVLWSCMGVRRFRSASILTFCGHARLHPWYVHASLLFATFNEVQLTMCMSQYWLAVRKILNSKVPAYYYLNTNNLDHEEQIDALLEGKRYIFPGDIMVCARCYCWPLLISCGRGRLIWISYSDTLALLTLFRSISSTGDGNGLRGFPIVSRKSGRVWQLSIFWLCL